MRRDTRKHENAEKNKSILYIAGSILGIGVIAFVITFVLYGNKMEEQSSIGSDRIASLVQEATTNTQSASTKIGKTVEESKNEIKNSSINTVNNTVNSTNTVKTTETKETKSTTTKETTNNASKKEKATEDVKTEDPIFAKPVEGEISKEFAKDNLLYSQTLEEWSTHTGIDIKADKTTVVKASAEGKVKSIKNDPRYGLTIIIEHQNGYETLYANLLTSEFVQVGETVKQGQSIGTVGNSATFEIADDPHLHFEISKNGEMLDPTGLIK